MDFWRFDRAGLDPSSLIVGDYDPRLVFLSFLVASIASYAALEVIERVTAAPTRRARRYWIAAGSVAMGLGVWAMHFIGMLSFSLPMPMTYDLNTTIVSALPAILASGVAIHVLSLPMRSGRLLAGGALMAAGIGTMHFTGMEAMRGAAELYYDPVLFIGSLLVAFALATLAFWAEFKLSPREGVDPLSGILVSAPILGAAVCGMHYTAMRASIFQATPGSGAASSMVFTPFALSVAILLVTSLILAIAVGGTWIHRRLDRAHTTIARLEGLLPICAWCKKIRGEDGSWQDLEAYIRSRSKARFSHGICAQCEREF